MIASVFNPDRSKLTVNTGYDPFEPVALTPKLELPNSLKADGPRVWDDEPFDAIPLLHRSGIPEGKEAAHPLFIARRNGRLGS